MGQAYGLERRDRAYVNHKRLGRVSCMDPLERTGRVSGHCERMDLVCAWQEGIDVVAAVDKGRCSRFGRIRCILLDCCLEVSDTSTASRSRLTRVLRIACLDTSTTCSQSSIPSIRHHTVTRPPC